MKASTCLLTMLVLFGVSYVHAQEPVYYWSGGRKLYLNPFPDMAVFRTDGDTLSV